MIFRENVVIVSWGKYPIQYSKSEYEIRLLMRSLYDFSGECCNRKLGLKSNPIFAIRIWNNADGE